MPEPTKFYLVRDKNGVWLQGVKSLTDHMVEALQSQGFYVQEYTCGYCTEPAVAWMTWRTIGRPKGAPVCMIHAIERNTPDNFGVLPRLLYLNRTKQECEHPGVFADLKHDYQHCYKCDQDVLNSEL